MSYYVNVVAKSNGHAAMVADLYEQEFGEVLIWTFFKISEEAMKLGINVTEWERQHPHQAASQVGGFSFGVSDLADAQTEALLKRKFAWVLDHTHYFCVIEGLREASALLDSPFDYDFVINGETGSWEQLTIGKSWGDLPVLKKDAVMQRCQEWNIPSLWAAVLLFRERTDLFGWFVLKDIMLPWNKMTVESALKTARSALNGHGAEFSNIPTRFELERALRI